MTLTSRVGGEGGLNMAVDFCDYFWGEKHDGFQVLYQNMKSGLTATKDLTDAVRETALMQENNSKVIQACLLCPYNSLFCIAELF